VRRLALLLLPLLLAWPCYAAEMPPDATFEITAQVIPAPPDPMPAPPLLIDGVEAAPPGSLIYLEGRTQDGKPCSWVCVPDSGNFRVVDGGTAAVFTSGLPGVWTFIAAANAETGPPLIASHVITIGEPIPVPPTPPVPPPIPPDPPTPPTPPAGPRWVIILEESAERTPQLAAVITSPTLRRYLSDNKHHPLRTADKDSQAAWLQPYKALVPAGTALPRLLIVADPIAGSSAAKVLHVGPVPATAEAVIAELRKAGG